MKIINMQSQSLPYSCHVCPCKHIGQQWYPGADKVRIRFLFEQPCFQVQGNLHLLISEPKGSLNPRGPVCYNLELARPETRDTASVIKQTSVAMAGLTSTNCIQDTSYFHNILFFLFITR